MPRQPPSPTRQGPRTVRARDAQYLAALLQPAFVATDDGEILARNAAAKAIAVEENAFKACVQFALYQGARELKLLLHVSETRARTVVVVAVDEDRDIGDAERNHLARARWALSAREAEVMARVAVGRSNKEIAEDLGCAPRTVERHVSTILGKAGAGGRSRLVATYWRVG